MLKNGDSISGKFGSTQRAWAPAPPPSAAVAALVAAF